VTATGEFKPNLRYRITKAIQTFGLLLVGVGVVVTALAVKDLASLARRNQEEADCRAQIAADLAVVEAELNGTGWDTLLTNFTHPRPDPNNPTLLDPEVQKRVDKMLELLNNDLPRTKDRRDRIIELCER
jgi:hypothetical protein